VVVAIILDNLNLKVSIFQDNNLEFKCSRIEEYTKSIGKKIASPSEKVKCEF